MDKTLSDKEYIALLEKRDEESRRTIRTLASMLTSAMDRIEELQKSKRRSPTRISIHDTLRNGIDNDCDIRPLFLDSTDITELLGVSRSTALKFMKSAGGIQVGNRWRISETKLDEFISEGKHIDLSET